jgi:hypothetical protein
LAKLNDSITSLERKVEFLEARVTKGETLNWQLRKSENKQNKWWPGKKGMYNT